MRFDIVTLFPGLFAGIFEHGVVKRAIAKDLVKVVTHDLREFTSDRHRTVDDRPFGGGEGMVLKPEPIARALESIGADNKSARQPEKESVILLSAQGQSFTQAIARDLASLERIVLICGRYEGVDERVNDLFVDQELSIGDYVLSGGELGAAVIIDAIMRLLPGVLGNGASSKFESFGSSEEELLSQAASTASSEPQPVPSSTHAAGGLLDYPHYTRPVEFRGLTVPDVLSSGNHEQIRRWRRESALEKTLRNRPDLLKNASLSDADLRALDAWGIKQHP